MTIVRFALVLIASLSISLDAMAQDTSITYQGQLKQTGQPFTGLANFQFLLFDQLSGGGQIGATQFRPNWPVEDGLFQAELDFGLAAFTEQVRYLEVQVNGIPLTPRQAIRPSPMALFALSGNEGPAGPPGASPFTLDPVTGTIEYLFNNQVFRFEPDTSFGFPAPPKITLGWAANQNLASGGVISGGGSNLGVNTVSGQLGTVSGGDVNTASGNRSVVGGGSSNTASNSFATVSGGLENTASGTQSAVSGGDVNTASGPQSAVGGGRSNTASNSVTTVAGGFANTASGAYATVGGGWLNCAGGDYSWAGGRWAKVRPGSGSGAPASGCNQVSNSGDANGDEGTFAWADGQASSFVSSGPNQFLVRASGGAVFTSGSVNDPAGNRVRVDGLLRVDTLGSAGATSLCRNANNQIASCSSSVRYKQDIVTLESGMALIDQLRPVQYRWIDSGEPDLGFVAEEVAELIPEVITYNQSGEVEGIEYNRLTVVLVRAMQEQQDENRLLRAELAQLKEQTEQIELLATRNADLQDRLAALEALLLEGRKLAGGQ